MISPGLGATFAPTSDPTAKPPATPVESAVQLISTQLPRVFGATTPVAPQLLAGSGGVHPDVASAVVRSVLAALGFGRTSAAAAGGAGTAGSEAASLAGAVSRGAGAPGSSPGSILLPPQFTFSNPPPSARPPVAPLPGNSGTPGGIAPPAIPAFSGIGGGVGTGDPNIGDRRV